MDPNFKERGRFFFNPQTFVDLLHLKDKLMSQLDTLPMVKGENADLAIDVARGRFPNCIVWSPLPPITWFLPFIGHTGICDSDGVIWDFAGPYTIGRANMAFGEPTRYIQLNPNQAKLLSWNEGVEKANKVYSKRMHNIFCDNCHSHVARALNEMGYGNDIKTNFGMIRIGVWFFFFGKFTSIGGFIKTYLPSTILVLILVFITGKANA